MSINIYCNSINNYYNKNKAVLNLNFKTAFVFNFIKTDCIQSGTEVRFNMILSARVGAAHRLIFYFIGSCSETVGRRSVL